MLGSEAFANAKVHHAVKPLQALCSLQQDLLPISVLALTSSCLAPSSLTVPLCLVNILIILYELVSF